MRGLFASVSDWYASGHDINKRGPIAEAAASLRSGEHPLPPFHWEIEFAEVFSRANGGFDAFVGNPPFLGGTRISAEFGMEYFALLREFFPPAGHLCDQVAYFFRNCFAHLRHSGTLGLLATNTISQGDTRHGGLLQLLKEGEIYAARRRYRWPGEAAVMVSVVHVIRGKFHGRPILDKKPVRRISAFLMEGDVDSNPARLNGNPYFSLGSKIYGQGFLFDDHDVQATPLGVMDELLKEHPKSAERVFPYIGGKELLSVPTLRKERFVIYLSDLETEEDIESYPRLAAIVRERVKPGRDVLGSNPNNVPLKRRWWAYQAHRPELYDRVRQLSQVLVCAQVSSHMVFSFLPPDWVYSQRLVVFDIENHAEFGLLQSRVHEVWTRFFSSTLKDDLSYAASDCFETFPFPPGVDDLDLLARVGRTYFEYRSQTMESAEQGLTTIYNRFHDPHEQSSKILHLRELHAAMDRAMLAAYGWDDLVAAARCEFLLDYEEEDDDEPGGKKSKKKKPWRLRWPDEFRDEVLARLLELNEQRHQEEQLTGVTAEAKAKGISVTGLS